MKHLGKISAGLVLGLGTLGIGATALAGSGHYGEGRHGEQRMERMADKLELDSAQREQVQAALDARRDEIKSLHEQLREERRALREQLKTGYDEAAVQARAATIGDLVERMVVAKARTGADLQAVLTPEQQDKLGQMMARRGERHGRHHGEQED